MPAFAFIPAVEPEPPELEPPELEPPELEPPEPESGVGDTAPPPPPPPQAARIRGSVKAVKYPKDFVSTF